MIRCATILFISMVFLAESGWAQGARLKDIANIRGVRSNQLVGYGLVVGLKGTGDGKQEFTAKSFKRMLDKLGMKLTTEELESKNVAAVIVTANLPPFARAGNRIDVTVNSIGDASDLSGGTLLQTPLRAADQEVYAVAQGSLLLGASQAAAHTTVGRIPDGAIIEKDMDAKFADRKMFRLTLHNPDFTSAARVAKTINLELGGKYAAALDAATIDIITPFSFQGRGVELLATIESLQVHPDSKAKVIINEKTGTVVIGTHVRVLPVAISHGDLTVKVGQSPVPIGRGPASQKADGDGERVALIDGSANVGDLVKSLNRLGVHPKDLITILQNLKAAGALQGELEIL